MSTTQQPEAPLFVSSHLERPLVRALPDGEACEAGGDGVAVLAAQPDWTSRPWGRPIIHPAAGANPNLVATCDFRYHGIKIRGVRIFRGAQGLSINMPQKKFGDSIQNAVYFLSPDERELFYNDVLWLCSQVLGRRAQLPQRERLPA